MHSLIMSVILSLALVHVQYDNECYPLPGPVAWDAMIMSVTLSLVLAHAQ